MRRTIPILLTAILLLGSARLVGAAQPEIEIGLQPETAALGDRLTLTLTVRREEGTTVLQPAWDLDPEKWAVLGALPAQSQPIPEGGGSIETFTYQVAFYDLETAEFPAGSLAYIDADGQREMEIPPIPVNVQPLIGEEEEAQPKPDRGTIDLSYPWWYWLAGVLALAALGAAIYAAMRWSAGRYRIGESEELDSTLEPFAEALAAFREIEREKYLSRGQVGLHYLRTTETVKRFLERALGFFALEATTEEIAQQLPQRLEEEALTHETLAFFRDGDFVKFAKLDPGAENAEGFVGRAKELVMRIHKTVEAQQEPSTENEPQEGVS